MTLTIFKNKIAVIHNGSYTYHYEVKKPKNTGYTDTEYSKNVSSIGYLIGIIDYNNKRYFTIKNDNEMILYYMNCRIILLIVNMVIFIKKWESLQELLE